MPAKATVYVHKFWQATRRYGQNVVLWWTNTTGAKRTDVTWRRLHAALTTAAK